MNTTRGFRILFNRIIHGFTGSWIHECIPVEFRMKIDHGSKEK